MGFTLIPFSTFLFHFLAITTRPILVTSKNTTKPSSISHQLINQGSSGCQTSCGKLLNIPYPFGITKGCFYDEYYQITCETDVKNPDTFHPMYRSKFEVLDINLAGAQIRLSHKVAVSCYDDNHNISSQQSTRSNFSYVELGRFTIPSSDNVFAASGCDTVAFFQGQRRDEGKNKNKNKNEGKDYVSFDTACLTMCSSPQDVEINGTCSGSGCCQTAIPHGVSSVNITTATIFKYADVKGGLIPCSFGFVAAIDTLPAFTLKNLTTPLGDYDTPTSQFIVDWMIGIQNCSMAKTSGNCLCSGPNTVCNDSLRIPGYRCNCLVGFSGNPYLQTGCHDINECVDKSHDCEKQEYCHNTIGNFTCRCDKGSHGQGRINDPCLPNKIIFSKLFKIVVGIGSGLLISMVIAFWMYWQRGKNQLMGMRAKFFYQNGGHILHQKLHGQDLSVERFKIFSIEELKVATNNYSENNIIGRGGFGMVYRATLSNNEVVAVKRSLKVDSNQTDQFVNEVLVLSQLNNRNVVKLLGCCLETEVPLLVYEYIDNGTLFDHLHDEKKPYLTWEVRLRIVVEIAEVLAYLHSTISVPIIHRDIKSMNILLDESYTAKVSDFGSSKLAPLDEDQLGTIVQGTRGYLDPEYMQTGELTEKSDVYSFGVVLVELLIRQKAVCFERPIKERCLAIYFLRKLKDDRLVEILDDKIKEDGAIEQMIKVGDIARRCLELKGEDRPTMKQIAKELVEIKGNRKHLFVKETHDQNLEIKDGHGFIDDIHTPSSTQSYVHNLVSVGNGR